MYHKSFSHPSWRLLAVLATLLLSLPAAFLIRAIPAAPAAPGDLDTTFAGFGTSGVVAVAASDAKDMARLPDGKIVTAGTKAGDILLMRFLPDGRPDNTFFDGGIAQSIFRDSVSL